MKDWTCTVEFVVTGGELSREADSMLTRKGVRRVPHKLGCYVFTQVSTYDDYLQALMGTVGELDAVMSAYQVKREVYAVQAVQMQ